MGTTRCPICGGNGLVPEGFYRQTSGCWGSTSTIPETCRSCGGQGYVAVSDEYTQDMAAKEVADIPARLPSVRQVR